MAGAETIKQTQNVGVCFGDVVGKMPMESWRGGLAGEAVFEFGDEVYQ